MEYQENKQTKKSLSEKYVNVPGCQKKWDLSYTNRVKSGHILFCCKKGANHIPGSTIKGAQFDTYTVLCHIRSYPHRDTNARIHVTYPAWPRSFACACRIAPFFRAARYMIGPLFSTKSIWMAPFFWIPMWKAPFFWHPGICTYFSLRDFSRLLIPLVLHELTMIFV